MLFHELARKELLDARDYYDELVYGLGQTFVNEIEKSLKVIKNKPLSFPVANEDIRKAVVLKFPYSIFYRIEGKNIYILAIAHQKREPKYWISRK